MFENYHFQNCVYFWCFFFSAETTMHCKVTCILYKKQAHFSQLFCLQLFNQQQCFIYSNASFLSKLRAKKVETLHNSSFYRKFRKWNTGIGFRNNYLTVSTQNSLRLPTKCRCIIFMITSQTYKVYLSDIYTGYNVIDSVFAILKNSN
jgi:hypothetical protein